MKQSSKPRSGFCLCLCIYNITPVQHPLAPSMHLDSSDNSARRCPHQTTCTLFLSSFRHHSFIPWFKHRPNLSHLPPFGTQCTLCIITSHLAKFQLCGESGRELRRRVLIRLECLCTTTNCLVAMSKRYAIQVKFWIHPTIRCVESASR
jgi:hypothetical protein